MCPPPSLRVRSAGGASDASKQTYDVPYTDAIPNIFSVAHGIQASVSFPISSLNLEEEDGIWIRARVATNN